MGGKYDPFGSEVWDGKNHMICLFTHHIPQQPYELITIIPTIDGEN